MIANGDHGGVGLKKTYVNLGKSPTRKDAILKVTGKGKFAQDIKLPEMLWGKVLRSPYAHAHITRIDASRAEALPGVVAVVTYTDCPPSLLLGYPPTKPVFVGAVGQKVRFVGDAIAGVAAETSEIAEEALKLIEVDYQQLPAVLDPEAALKSNATQIYAGGNFIGDRGPEPFSPSKYSWIYEGGDSGSGYTIKGDIEQGLKNADFIIEFVSRNANVPCMRTQADTCVAQFIGDKLTIWTPTQGLMGQRDAVAAAFGLPLSSVRCISECSGGGFGGAGWLTMDFEAVLLAKKAGRPVKLVYTERELLNLTAHVCRGPSYVKVGARNDGTITALDITLYSDGGAFDYGASINKYRWPTATLFRPQNIRYKCYRAFTNTPPGGFMRGPGSEDIISIIEEAALRISEHIGMDPAEYHIKFCPTPGYIMPPGGYPSPVPNERWSSTTSFPDDIKTVLDAIGWKNKYHAAGKGRVFDGSRKRGVGIAFAVKGCSYLYGFQIMIKIFRDGSINLLFGTSNPGVATGTALCQIAAEVIGVKSDDIGLVWGDTDATPYGGSHSGSSGLTGAGTSTIIAAKSVREQLLNRASIVLDVKPEELDIDAVDNIFVRADPIKKTTMKNVMSKTWSRFQDITASGSTFGPDEYKKRGSWMIWTSAARAYEVEVDTETGLVEVLNHAACYNVGNPIHMKILEGQASSGNWQGAWRTLSTDEVLDPHTGVELVISSVERQYTTMLDEPLVFTPHFRASPEPFGPYGAAGIGENVLLGTRAAITAAVYNAIGVWVKPPPITPDKVLAAMGKI